MTLTKEHKYTDQDGDSITVPLSHEGFPDVMLRVSDESDTAGAYVEPKFSVPLALNVLGYDRPDDDRVTTTRDFIIGEGIGVQCTATVAHGEHERVRQLNLAVALLHAVDAFDQRAARLATAEERRNEAAQRLTDAVSKLHNAGPGPFTGDEIGKLREALGRFDAELSK